MRPKARAFHFTKPPGFAYTPGQFANFSLPRPAATDDAGMQRSFSIASAPYEDEIMIATRMRPSAFKRTLAAMPAGTRLAMEGPHGELVQEDDGRPAVFLAGGIGITPFLSMLRDAAHRGDARRPAEPWRGRRRRARGGFRGILMAALNRPFRFAGPVRISGRLRADLRFDRPNAHGGHACHGADKSRRCRRSCWSPSRRTRCRTARSSSATR
jgi:hypothetical protein